MKRVGKEAKFVLFYFFLGGGGENDDNSDNGDGDDLQCNRDPTQPK